MERKVSLDGVLTMLQGIEQQHRDDQVTEYEKENIQDDRLPFPCEVQRRKSTGDASRYSACGCPSRSQC